MPAWQEALHQCTLPVVLVLVHSPFWSLICPTWFSVFFGQSAACLSYLRQIVFRFVIGLVSYCIVCGECTGVDALLYSFSVAIFFLWRWWFDL